MKKKIVWTSALVIVLAAGTWGGIRFYNKQDTQMVASYVTTPVRKGTIEVKVSGTGSIQPSVRETLKASSAGKALKVNFKQGDAVKKGDVLITYEQEDVTDQVRSKEIELKKKKLELADSQTKYKEAADDTARAAMVLSIQKQELDIEMTQDEISSLKTEKSLDPILAPIDGVLATFDVQAGDTLNPNNELGEIVNFAKLQMVVGIDELDIPKVKLKQEAQILVEALPEEKFTGEVVSIADEGTTSNGVASFDVTIVLADAKTLKAGMSAEASIMTEKKTDALYVPVEAVQSSQGKYFVMIPGASSETGTGAGATRGQQSGQTDSNPGAAPQSGQAGQVPQVGDASRFQNMTDEERAAMREQFMANRGNGSTNANSGNTVASSRRMEVEVGINNEDQIEILSGLQEGDLVILPTGHECKLQLEQPSRIPRTWRRGLPWRRCRRRRIPRRKRRGRTSVYRRRGRRCTLMTTTSTSEPLIRIKQLSKQYRMGGEILMALDNVSLTVRQGDFLAIIGPSGSGKSTLMNVIGCLDTPSSGEYWLDGEEVSRLRENKLAEIRNRKIGFIFQGFNLLSRLTAIENVELPLIYRGVPAKERKESAVEALRKVGLEERIHHRPVELSGGQQQRVAIARALAGNPPILLADEPTGALDTKTGKEVMGFMKELNALGHTIVLITHDLGISEQAKRVVRIMDGKLNEEEGGQNELLTSG
ncbi:efflux RND transporter periplasmic adaptor subunit [Cohnella cholangitidis]|uniref:Efflux RND transporter periplasmic adaptor subunit n=2 Tax=Cohnella cholangitidis TaxID=2598458 RepID=A0A7G5C604_9BACL|nr:efflux RND transporter periplasmic adaptor subunit [Cohnella cholangitidis]